MLKSESARKILRFGLVGLTVMVFFMALNWLFGHIAGPSLAFLAAYPPALGLHYFLSKRWTFNDTTRTDRRKVASYLFMVGVTFVIQWLAFAAVRRAFAWPPWCAAGVANLVQMSASFLLMQYHVFGARAAARIPAGPVAGGKERAQRGLALAIAIGVMAFYFWTVKSTRADWHFGGQKDDYYNLLVDGFQDGHLYMKVAVDPALLALPQDRRPGNAPFLLDASLYGGHYYLYFGVAPAVTLYWPVAALTGQDMPQAMAALVFAGLALGFSFAWWCEMRRIVLPRLGPKWDWLAVVALGFCTVAPSALRRPLFYEVATLSGWAHGALMLWALVRAGRSERRAGVWLLIAGIACGLAVGSRANLAPAGLLALVTGAVLTGRKFGPTSAVRWRGIGIAFVLAGSGAGVIGAGLAAYNYLRFGSVVEFGHAHQLGLNPQQMFRLTNLAHNLRLYYAQPPQLNAYFPYVLPPSEGPKPVDYLGRESVHGEWIWVLVLLAALPLAWRAGRRPADGASWRILMPMAIWFGGNVLITGSTGVRANRYMLDFHPALVALTFLGIGLAVDGVSGWRRWAARGLATSVVVAALFNVLASLQVHGFFEHTDPEGFRRLARPADNTLFRAAPGLFRTLGDRETELRWPSRGNVGRFPLVSAGQIGFDDRVWVETDGQSQARLSYQHAEFGTAEGSWFAFEPDHTSRIRVSGGFLLPPVEHPWYGVRTGELRAALKRRVRVWVDDQIRFDRDVPSFDSAPWLVRWGSGQLGDAVRRHPGVLSPVRRREIDEAWAAGLGTRRGMVRLRLRLPADRYGSAEPLVQTGTLPGCDVLMVWFTRPGYVRLLHDCFGAGGDSSPEFAVDYGQWQAVEVEMPMSNDGLAWNQRDVLDNSPVEHLSVRWNGQKVFTSALTMHPAGMQNLVLGANLVGASSGRMSYAGEIQPAPFLEPLRPVQAGTLEPRIAPDQDFIGVQGVLAWWQRADRRRAAVVWRRAAIAAPVQLGWLDEGHVTWAARPLGHAAGMLRLELPELPDRRAEQALFSRGRGRGLVELSQDGEKIFALPTDFFADGPVSGWALAGRRWTGSALAAAGSADDPPRPERPASLPGRIEVRFALPKDGLKQSVPLLSAGKAGAADSLFLRPNGDGRYIIGLDHWGVDATEGAPVAIAPGEVISLIIEMGSLFPAGEFPADRTRVSLDGIIALEARVPLYFVKPEEIEIGRNSIGLSTSGPQFVGEIYSVHTQVRGSR